MSSKCSSKPEFKNVSRVLLPILVILHHHWWSSCSPHNLKYHLSLSCPCMRQCHCSHRGMGIDIHCWVSHFHVCKMFFQVLYLSVQCSLSIGTVWKSSSSSECSGVLSGSWSPSELLEVNDRWQHTGLGGVCGEPWYSMVAGQ